ncbi:MAG: hypothetical protein ABWY06_13805 [Pseudomonas sp.]|uniref:hypothetical protein n=1 Tax=Pseudomonas sp. TaxID=306 RepID=UPI00339A187D
MDDSREQVRQEFGSRMGLLGQQVVQLSRTGQPCDLTFFKRKPILDVRIDPQLFAALQRGVDTIQLTLMLARIRLSNGQVVSLEDIWSINPMPRGGLRDEQLQAVDLGLAEQAVGPDGETLRSMIGQTYHCQTREDEDRCLRRFLAS